MISITEKGLICDYFGTNWEFFVWICVEFAVGLEINSRKHGLLMLEYMDCKITTFALLRMRSDH
jgi:hypothetical protein